MLWGWEKIPYMPKMGVWAIKDTTLYRNTKCGQKLVVEGVGKFFVEWHLHVDVRIIECMYISSLGANAKQFCIYYTHDWFKNAILNEDHAMKIQNMKKMKSKDLFPTWIGPKQMKNQQIECGIQYWTECLHVCIFVHCMH